MAYREENTYRERNHAPQALFISPPRVDNRYVQPYDNNYYLNYPRYIQAPFSGRSSHHHYPPAPVLARRHSFALTHSAPPAMQAQRLDLNKNCSIVRPVTNKRGSGELSSSPNKRRKTQQMRRTMSWCESTKPPQQQKTNVNYPLQHHFELQGRSASTSRLTYEPPQPLTNDTMCQEHILASGSVLVAPVPSSACKKGVKKEKRVKKTAPRSKRTKKRAPVKKDAKEKKQPKRVKKRRRYQSVADKAKPTRPKPSTVQDSTFADCLTNSADYESFWDELEPLHNSMSLDNYDPTFSFINDMV